MPVLGTRGGGSIRGFGSFGTGTPAAPQNVSVTIDTSTNASISFTAPSTDGGLPITGYRVTTSPGNLTFTGSTSPIALTGLSANTNYTFTVQAQNAVGYGGSATTSASTPQFPSVSGGTLYSDATYYYRAFTSSGSLSVSNSKLYADIVIIAGGGANSGNTGGAGSGGASYNANYALNPSSYSFSVGGAGSNSTGLGYTAYAGANSPAGGAASVGLSGGSGSGGWTGSYTNGQPGGAPTQASGATTTTLGNFGGSSSFGFSYVNGGGGGGLGGGGGQGVGSGKVGYGGAGGQGTTMFSSWGAACGLGTNISGTYYFGGGAGGYAQATGSTGYGTGANTGGVGSSGVVMVRYLRSRVGG